MFKVGTVTHYYDKIQVAIVKLSGTLSVGDKIAFKDGGEVLFEQKVESIQVEHNKLDSAGSGEIIGLKVDKSVSAGIEIFKL